MTFPRYFLGVFTRETGCLTGRDVKVGSSQLCFMLFISSRLYGESIFPDVFRPAPPNWDPDWEEQFSLYKCSVRQTFIPSNIYIRHKEVQNSSYGGRWRECAPSSRQCRPAIWTNQVLPPSTQKVSKKPSYFLTFNLR